MEYLGYVVCFKLECYRIVNFFILIYLLLLLFQSIGQDTIRNLYHFSLSRPVYLYYFSHMYIFPLFITLFVFVFVCTFRSMNITVSPLIRWSMDMLIISLVTMASTMPCRTGSLHSNNYQLLLLSNVICLLPFSLLRLL